MKIAIDASRAINEKAGIGRYTKELIKALLKIDTKLRAYINNDNTQVYKAHLHQH